MPAYCIEYFSSSIRWILMTFLNFNFKFKFDTFGWRTANSSVSKNLYNYLWKTTTDNSIFAKSMSMTHMLMSAPLSDSGKFTFFELECMAFGDRDYCYFNLTRINFDLIWYVIWISLNCQVKFDCKFPIEAAIPCLLYSNSIECSRHVDI